MILPGQIRKRSPRRIIAILACVVLAGIPIEANPDRTYIHVIVALCDNENQGIAPVPARLGNGLDLKGNLYWGASAGLKTYFSRSSDWRLEVSFKNPAPMVLERCVFKHRGRSVYLVADAYRGDSIKSAIRQFLYYSSGRSGFTVSANGIEIDTGGRADLIAYVGHNGLMDFNLSRYPARLDNRQRKVIIISCLSRKYFKGAIKLAGAYPVLWTNGLLAAEAYTLKGALDGYIRGEPDRSIRDRAAQAYNRYQHCGMRAARNLFTSGW
jgi:hypothetical protein